MMMRIVYDILGSTDKLSTAQMNNLIAGRKYIVQLATRHPGEMYINGPIAENNAQQRGS